VNARLKAPGFVLAIPAAAWLVFFFAVPVLLISYASLGYKPNGSTTIAMDSLSLERYSEVFSESSTFPGALRGTVGISILGTIVCLVIGYPFAYWLAVRVDAKRRGVLLVLMILPSLVSFLTRAIGWRILLAPEGPISGLLQDVGMIGAPLDVLFSRFAVQVGAVHSYLPLMILPLYVALSRLDPAMREASRDLGAGRWKTTRQVTLPIAFPGIVAGSLLVFILLTGDYVIGEVLGAEDTMAAAVVAEQFQLEQNWALGSAMVIVMIATILAVIGVMAAFGMIVQAQVRRNRRVHLWRTAT
jgi:spermidine/putrescine transport system permease protein